MEWFEHTHDHDHEDISEPCEAELAASAALRLSVQLKKRLGMSYCHLLFKAEHALTVAIELLFSSELGERALYPCDEVLILSPDGKKIAEAVSSCGGCPICISAPENAAELRLILEEALSPATRALIVENLPSCHKNLHTVRNFCNKYDLWMIEKADISPDARCEIDGKSYCAGGVGDWSYFDLSALKIQGGALLIRDGFINALAAKHLADLRSLDDTAASLAQLPWRDAKEGEL